MHALGRLSRKNFSQRKMAWSQANKALPLAGGSKLVDNPIQRNRMGSFE